MDLDLVSVIGEADEVPPSRRSLAHLVDAPSVEIDDFDKGILIGNQVKKNDNPTMDYIPVSTTSFVPIYGFISRFSIIRSPNSFPTCTTLLGSDTRIESE